MCEKKAKINTNLTLEHMNDPPFFTFSFPFDGPF